MATDKNRGHAVSDVPSSSGFGPVPTRIGSRPPLMVGPDSATASVREQVIELLAEFSSKIAVVHRTAAEAYLSQDHYAEAITHLHTAVQYAPDDLEYRNQLGFVQYLAGDDQAAIESFTGLLQRQPDHPDALFNLGMVRFGLGEIAGAAECFGAALAARGDDAETWNNHGVCLFQLGRVADAVASFRRALAIDPQHPDAAANLRDMPAA